MSDQKYTVLLNDPLVQADFGRMTMKDFFKVIDDPDHLFVVMMKCIVEDAESIPFQYVPMIIEAFLTEYTRAIKDTTTTHQLQKLFTNRTNEDATQ